MISTNPFLEPPPALENLASGGQGSSPRWSSSQKASNNCETYLRNVVADIETPQVKEVVEVVFKDLLRLLECLGLIEGHLRQVDAADETFALFKLIHDEARAMVTFIRSDALNSPAISEELADTLDGITFVINHDLQRVFETDSGDASSESTTHIILSKMHRAHDVLTNCLQQSTISLAVMFDSTLVGAKLFDNSDIRYRQSLQLCQDLLTLRQVVENVNEQANEEALVNLKSSIMKFRSESMECLMYADWPQFENFCERIGLSIADSAALMPVLNQFQCYLETLLGQVRMRAVFADQANPFADGPGFDGFANANAAFASQDEAPSWPTLSLAG